MIFIKDSVSQINSIPLALIRMKYLVDNNLGLRYSGVYKILSVKQLPLQHEQRPFISGS